MIYYSMLKSGAIKICCQAFLGIFCTLGAANAQSFDPAHKAAVVYSDKFGVVRSISGSTLRVSLENAGGKNVATSLPDDIVQVDTITGAQSNKVLVIGRVNGSAQKVVVINRSNGQILDQFLGYSVSPSPDGNFVAFIKFYPTHFVDSPSDYISLYDLRYNASLNRAAGISLDNDTDVGKLIYPLGVDAETANTGVPISKINLVVGPIIWNPNSSKFVLASETISPPDTTAAKNSRLPEAAIDLVLVDTFNIQSLPSIGVYRATSCLSRSASCSIQLSSVDFSSSGIAAEFQGAGNSVAKAGTFQVAFSQFVSRGP